ncbi:uncharacterized protein J7T54_002559 [Emericellopsis cladophorae]|uniref:Uncharacterized protein n=1 Tax=Emericellopsis cladophorae TaxID=2686198 RepID=A0A9P9Y137_9HYPO|nr:uncharacterized protein J7T54_002559 [Emericellopsis cladophorae]KAI6781203.1 hypothetical protein J7T54_002559 [Emericellopsis cladophorae]
MPSFTYKMLSESGAELCSGTCEMSGSIRPIPASVSEMLETLKSQYSKLCLRETVVSETEVEYKVERYG